MNTITKIDTIHENNKTIVKIFNSINFETYPSLQKVVENLTPKECKNIVFDMTKLNYISGSGIKTLLLARQKVLKENGEISILHPSNDIYNVLKSLYLDSIFNIKQ